MVLESGCMVGYCSVLCQWFNGSAPQTMRERLCSPVQAQVLAGDLEVVRPQFSHKTSIHLLVDARLEVSAH